MWSKPKLRQSTTNVSEMLLTICFHFFKTIIDDQNNSTDKSVDNKDLIFDGCENVTWHFNYNNNRIQVIDINNYRMNLYDWLIYDEDSLCFDNPLRYQIEFNEDTL